MAAIYSAAAQMVFWKYTLGKNADALAGSISILMFGAEKMITGFDWDNKTFSWITTDLVRTKLILNQEQLVDLCLLSGLTIMPAIDETIDSAQASIETARNMLRGNDGYTVSLAKGESYLALFKKAKVAIKHLPVIKKGGKIEPLNFSDTFDNLHECVSQRLPDEVLYYCTRGLGDPMLLSARTQMEYLDTAPLDSGNSTIYHDLVQQKLTPLRRQALAILSHNLARYWQTKDIDAVVWYNETTTTPLGIPEAVSSLSDVRKKWHVSEKTFQSFSLYQKVRSLSLSEYVLTT